MKQHILHLKKGKAVSEDLILNELFISLDEPREQHLSNAVEEVHRVVIVKVIDDIRQPLVIHPPLPTLGLMPLAKTHS